MEADERSCVNFISDSNGSPNDTISAWSRRYSSPHGILATCHGVSSLCADLNRFKRSLEGHGNVRAGAAAAEVPQAGGAYENLNSHVTSLILTNNHHSCWAANGHPPPRPFFRLISTLSLFSRGQREGVRCMLESSKSEHHTVLIRLQS